jgi:hypothetical protein
MLYREIIAAFYMQRYVYTTEAQNLLLSVSAFHGCHPQGAFIVVKVAIL